jgi:predicted amidohydrolase
MVISIAALQYPIGLPVALEDILHLFRRQPDFVCLPEYFAVDPKARSHADGAAMADKNLLFLEELSRELQCVVVGGTIAHPIDGGYGNICTIFDSGAKIGSYQKMNPTGHEEERRIIAGTQPRVFDIRGVKVGVLICADVLATGTFKTMRDLGAEVIFVPTVSPLITDDTVFAKNRRDQEIFVGGARTACAFVVKTCGVGTIFDGHLQGRSGIFAPWGILKQVTPDGESKKLVLTEHLDVDEIREFKELMSAATLADGETDGVDSTSSD